jgi:hypothetical protein
VPYQYERSPTPSDWVGSERSAVDSDLDTEPQDNNSEEFLPNIEDDPLYVDVDHVFDRGENLHMPDTEKPPAFYEDPILRNIYLHVFLEATFNHATHESVQSQLSTHYHALKAYQARGAPPIHGLNNMARTLRTVERRLGVDPDQQIVYYFLCNVCWDRHHPDDLSTLQSPSCTRTGCTGRLYTTKSLEKVVRRVPTKILASCPIIPQIQRILLRPGKFEELQRWRTPEDQPGIIVPDLRTGLNAFPDLDRPLNDVFDGWAWRAARAGLSRRQGGEWGVEDVDMTEINQCFVALPNGLLFMINIDWWVILTDLAHDLWY